MIVPDFWIERDSVDSTQAEIGRLLLSGHHVGILLAHEQTAGRGRFGRPWVSREGHSLTFSIALQAYVGHPKPWLLGMAVAIATAQTTGSTLRWPNDLAFDGRKVGGILTELLPDSAGRLVPVVGLGLNLPTSPLPPALVPIAGAVPTVFEPLRLAVAIVQAIRELPEPDSWEAIEPLWQALDTTPGKKYKLPNGDIAEALHVGSGGELRCRVGACERTVLAADALFGVS